MFENIRLFGNVLLEQLNKIDKIRSEVSNHCKYCKVLFDCYTNFKYNDNENSINYLFDCYQPSKKVNNFTFF